MEHNNYYSGRLAKKIVIYVILLSAAITLFTSGVQIYSEFKRDVNGVHLKLDQLEKTQLSNIASDVWVLDMQELEHTLHALLTLPAIRYIAVYDYDKLLISVGQNFIENAITKKHDLFHYHNNVNENIGSIVIKASLDEAYSLIIDRAITILLSNAVKTFIVAGFILFIFYNLVARHLLNIANFTQKEGLLNSNEKLTLNRESGNPEDDELDLVVNSINKMKNELTKQFKELDQQKQYLSLTLNSIGDAVITIDINGRITQMNPVAEKLTGWAIEDAKGHPAKSVFKINRLDIYDIIDNISDYEPNRIGLKRSDYETLLFSRDGNEYHISYLATPIKNTDQETLGMVLVFHDITEQFELRENIAKSKRDMQAIMNNSPAVIYIKDLEGKYLFVNKRYETLFEISLEQIVGETDSSLFDKEIAEKLEHNDKEVLDAGLAMEFEEIVPMLDGEEHVFMSVKFPLHDDTGQIYAICGISTDITMRKLQDNHFRHAQKMDALGKLTSGVSHDYNNMLGIIVGYAQLLDASLETAPQLRKYAQEIQRAGERGTKLTKKLLDFSSQDISDASTVNINGLIVEEQHMLEKTLTPRINLKLYLEEDLWDVHIDSGEFEDAIVNMIINAMHAIDGAGEIIVKTQNRTLSIKEAERHQITAGDYVLLSILDNGRGMDEETKEKLFDPFYSTKGAKGTGLGLSQVYGFIERSAGAIEVISNVGDGAQFNIYFPRSRIPYRELAKEKQNKNIFETISSGTGTILVVDDEPSLVNLLNESLVTNGYEVLTAKNGREALNILEKQQVDLIVTDIIMPNIDGVQLAAEVKKRYPHIKMQMVSGYTDNRINGSIETSLAQNILYKPFSMSELVHRIRTLLEDRPANIRLSGSLIMIMDDVEDMRELFKINLEKLGCEVVLVENGEQAITSYKEYMENAHPIDIVILDVAIPGGPGGEEIAEQLREIDPDAKILLASGYSESSNEDIVKKLQLNGFLEKNFNSVNLQKILEGVLAC